LPVAAEGDAEPVRRHTFELLAIQAKIASNRAATMTSWERCSDFFGLMVLLRLVALALNSETCSSEVALWSATSRSR
jgi:hypothetical protein